MPYFLLFLGVISGTTLSFAGYQLLAMVFAVFLAYLSIVLRSIIPKFAWLFLLGVGLFFSALRAGPQVFIYLGDTCTGTVIKKYDKNVSVRLDSCVKSNGKGVYIYGECKNRCPEVYGGVTVQVLSVKSFGKFFGEGEVVSVSSKLQSTGLRRPYYRVLGRFSSLKVAYYEKLRIVTSTEVAALVTSMLFGETYISKDLKELMKGAGVLHIVAISGVNIAYLLSFYSVVGKKLPYKIFKTGEWLLLAVLYLVVGEVLSLVRAIITLFWGVFMKRAGILEGSGGFWLSMSTLVIIDPWNLKDVAYWLVFSACFGVYVVLPLVSKFVKRSLLFDAVIGNLVVWVCVAPAQLLVFRRVSFISLLLMPLIGVLIEYLTILGYAGAVVLQIPIVSNAFSIVLGVLAAVILLLTRLFHGSA